MGCSFGYAGVAVILDSVVVIHYVDRGKKSENMQKSREGFVYFDIFDYICVCKVCTYIYNPI